MITAGIFLLLDLVLTCPTAPSIEYQLADTYFIESPYDGNVRIEPEEHCRYTRYGEWIEPECPTFDDDIEREEWSEWIKNAIPC